MYFGFFAFAGCEYEAITPRHPAPWCIALLLSLLAPVVLRAEGNLPVECSDAALVEWELGRQQQSTGLQSSISQLAALQISCPTKNAKASAKVKQLNANLAKQKGLCKSKAPGTCQSITGLEAKLVKAKKKRKKTKKNCLQKQSALAEQVANFQSSIALLDSYISECLPLLGPPEAEPSQPAECSDGVDNDADGLIDVENDPGCEGPGDVTGGSEGLPKTSQITQWGITFFFDKEYSFGQFVNGDYWVAPETPEGKVTIVDFEPKPSGNMHGWEVNPTRDHGLWQGFDYRVNLYQSALKPALPYAASAGDSILKVHSDGNGNDCMFPVNKQCLLTASVLTVLDKVPSQRGATFFRPPYVKGEKALVPVSSIAWGKLPSYALPEGASLPGTTELFGYIRRVQIDHLAVHEGRHKPKLHYKDPYGQSISNRNNDAVLSLMTMGEGSERTNLMLAFLQYGLDLFAILKDGQKWPAVGGHGMGRMLPILFAGAVLNHEGIKQFLAQPDEYRFGETHATYLSPATGKPLYGEVSSECTEFQYWDAMRSHGIARTCRDPYPFQGSIDGGERPGALYHSQIAGTLQATYVIFELMPALQDVFYDEAFMAYVKRWILEGTSTTGDLCAPAKGKCVGGLNDGLLTTSALGPILCIGVPGSGMSAQFEADMSLYGSFFGPDGAGGCILDEDPSDGIGRFPGQQGVYSDWGMNPFQKSMQAAYLTEP